MKKLIYKYIAIIIGCMIFLATSSCKKEWLDKKPNSKLAVLSTIEEYQKFMDNGLLYGGISLPVIGGDRYYIPDRNQSGLDAQNSSYYLWAHNGYASSFSTDWTMPYQAIFICNSTLEGLAKIDKSKNPNLWNEVYGSALFYRGYIYYQLAQIFAKQYNPTTANNDEGVPLRLEPNVNTKIGRGTVQQLYDQILDDLTKSIDLLPTTSNTFKTRPSKIAAYSALARYWLSRGDYEKAKISTESALAINSTLLDFNTITPSSTLGFASLPFNLNPEVFFYTFTFSTPTAEWNAIVDAPLYNSYSNNDLRKSIYFAEAAPNEYFFKGTYAGQAAGASDLFTAPAVDELYLIRAEANARQGNTSLAINDLNTLLAKRYRTGTFTPLVASSAQDALLQVLAEREKELVLRGVRWSDLRRLNKEPSLATTLTRNFQGKTYTLVPNSNWYVWPIPEDEIKYSGIAQNPR